jgi:hypothetical protein
MKIIYEPRMSGKTTKMIESLRKDERLFMITFSHAEENRLKQAYSDVSNRIVDFKSFLEARGKGTFFNRMNPNSRMLVIDNADYILEKIFGEYIREATFNKEVIGMRESSIIN